MYEEKRNHPRVRGDKEWLFVVQISIGQEAIITETKDISCSGIRCSIDQFFPKDSEVEMTLLVPLTEKGLIFEKIRCKARIVRCELAVRGEKESYETAFEFVDMSDKDKEKLGEYVVQTTELVNPAK